MKALERTGYLAHARTAAFARRIAQAEALIGDALGSNHDPWCVAFSGGKDSTVVLDLVRRQSSTVPVVWLDDGWDYPETLAFLEQTEQRLGRAIWRVCVPVMSPFWRETEYPGDDPTRAHPSDLLFADWTRGYSTFVGMRAAESSGRQARLRASGPLYYSGAWQHWQCCPLHDWTTRDVWAYLINREIPYNAVYDRLATLDVPLEQRRVGPLTAYMVWQYGTMATLRIGWPALYKRFAAALPEIGRLTG